MQEVDLDGDQQAEILVAASSPNVTLRSLLLVFEQTAAGRYEPFVREYLAMAMRLWHVEDVNRDDEKEIVTLGVECGAHTCYLQADVMQWEGNGYRSLIQSSSVDAPFEAGAPGVTMPSAQAQLRDSDGDGIQELVLEGGMFDSVGGGLQRTRTHVYTWDGQTYQLQAVTYDPVASQHPFFKLIDGNTALASGDEQAAMQLYEEAIATPFPPTEEYKQWKTAGPAVAAFARFRLLLATTRMGNADEAAAIYQTAQAEDADYAVWSRAFWEAYQDSGDNNAGCQAAVAATHNQPELLEPLNAFGYANPTFAPEDVCPLADQQPEPTPMVGAWEDFPPTTYPVPFAMNQDVVLNMSAGCPNLTDATERVTADQVSRDAITAVLTQFAADDQETRMRASDKAFWPLLRPDSASQQAEDSPGVHPDTFSDPQPASASPHAGLIANACGDEAVDYSWWVQGCPGLSPCDADAVAQAPSLTGNFYLIKRNGQWLIWAAE